MKLPTFLVGMVVAACGVGIAALVSGVSAGRTVLLVILTVVVAQLAYLATILLMERREKARRRPVEPASPREPEGGKTGTADSNVKGKARS